MEMNQSKYLAASLGLLVLVSASLFFFTREEERPEIDKAYFAVAETEKIDHVQLVTVGDTVDLMFDGSRWSVDGRWEADVQMIKVLMATLRQVESHRPVAATLTDSIKMHLMQRGTRVVLSEGGQTLLTFFASGNASNTESWFLKEGDKQPYIMIIPGYRVFVSGILQMQTRGWRNKRVFDFNWRNFKSLATTYPQQPAEDFKIEMKQRYFGITGIESVDTTRLNDYLDAVSLLMVKRFVDKTEAAVEKTLAKEPLVRIEIKDIAGRTYSLDLFMPGEAGAEIYGRMTGGQLVTIDRDAISSIARRRTYFVAKEH